MRGRRLSAAIAAGCVLIGFAACKDNTVNQTSNVTNNFTSVGPTGGFVTGPDGTRVDVPAGALSETVDMGIVEADAKEYPTLPSTVAPIGKIYAFHPHGQFFLIDATITMPAPAGDIDIYRAEPGGAWALFAKPKGRDGFVKFRSSTFSFYAATTGTGGCRPRSRLLHRSEVFLVGYLRERQRCRHRRRRRFDADRRGRRWR